MIDCCNKVIVKQLPPNKVTVYNYPPYSSSGGGVADFVVYDLIGTIDGSNATFTSPDNFVIDSVGVYINGILQKKVYGWNNTGTGTIIFTDSPQIGDILQIAYIKL